MAKKRRKQAHTDTLIGVYFTEPEKERIISMARSQKKTLSEYGREAILLQLFKDEVAIQQQEEDTTE